MNNLDDIKPALEFMACCLAPSAIFISVGLLLAGLQMKYTAILSDVRKLNAERRDECERRLRQSAGRDDCRENGGHTDAEDQERDRKRLHSIRAQMTSLLGRAWLVRCSLIWLYASVLLCLLASLGVGAAAMGMRGITPVVVALFVAGFTAILVGLAYALQEARRSFMVVAAEVRDMEEAGLVSVPSLQDKQGGTGRAAFRA
jgi:Na+/H+ antiporter NhaC